ncbi:hypothetical protein ACFXG1_13700 [Streptomyces sp. NPDC059248]|uniref:hypothetical protein n=1 Tax=Streptomyces sp. NPDC059248 TaxID=3346791 RepID=UPI0036CCE783
MMLESLLADAPPDCLRAPCCVCGRDTAAPVEVRHIPPDTVVYACPQDVVACAPGPVAHEA